MTMPETSLTKSRNAQSEPHADVAIIGSGVAGAMIANALAGGGLKVTVLEAGPRMDRDQIAENFRSRYVGQDLSAPYPNAASAPRPNTADPDDDYHLQDGPDRFGGNYLRLVGGTTWHWGAVTMRLLESDFRMKTRFGVGRDWPVSHNELALYYARAEDEMSVSGPADDPYNGARSGPYPLPAQGMTYMDHVIRRQAARLGMDFAQVPVARNSRARDGRSACMGFGSCSPICPSGAQYAAIAHVEKAEKAGVSVIDNALVMRLDAGADGQLQSLTYRRPDGALHRLKARVFVVAANALETPRLLLMSATESMPGGLANSSGLVGRNLMAHPGFNATMRLADPVYPGRGPRTGLAWQARRDGPHRKQHAAYYLQTINAVNVAGHAAALLAQGLMGDALDAQLRDRVARLLNLFVRAEQLPDANNRLRLDETQKDSAGQPKIRFAYSLGDYTKAGLADARAHVRRLARHLGGTELEFFAEGISPHAMGTACMGRDAKSSVVDTHGRAHDHSNLFIAGGAVFPSGGTATPTLTIAALSLRTAETLRRQLAQGG